MQIEDKLSVTFAVSAALIIMYLETILGNPPSLDIAITLLSVGIGLQIIVWGRIKRDSTMSQNELTNIVKFGLFAFTAMMIASSVVPAIFVNAEVGTPLESISGLSVTDQILHGQVYAISEEVFFRGILASALRHYLKAWQVVLFVGFIFMISHFGWYPGPLLLGFATTAIFLWRRSLIAPILLHAGCNAFGPLLVGFFPSTFRSLSLFFQ